MAGYLHNLKNPAVTAWIRLGRVSQKVQPAMAATLRKFGINLSQFDILSTLGARAGITQQQLAESLLMTKGNMVYHLARLEERGLVLRMPDGRKNLLYLTSKGESLLNEALPEHEALLSERFAGLTRQETRQLADLLSKLDRSL